MLLREYAIEGWFIIPHLLTNVSALPRETWTQKLCVFSTPQACVFSCRMWVAVSMRDSGKARGRHFEHLQLTGSVQRMWVPLNRTGQLQMFNGGQLRWRTLTLLSLQLQNGPSLHACQHFRKLDMQNASNYPKITCLFTYLHFCLLHTYKCMFYT